MLLVNGQGELVRISFSFCILVMDSISKGMILISSLWFGWCILGWCINWNKIATEKKIHTNNEYNMKIKPQKDDYHQQCALFLIQYRYGYCFKLYALNASKPIRGQVASRRMRRKTVFEFGSHWTVWCWVLSNAYIYYNKMRTISIYALVPASGISNGSMILVGD